LFCTKCWIPFHVSVVSQSHVPSRTIYLFVFYISRLGLSLSLFFFFLNFIHGWAQACWWEVWLWTATA
jgi:hypothetical protein